MMPTYLIKSDILGEAEVLKRTVYLRLQGVLAEEATDVRKLSSEGHLCSLSLAPEAAETVFNDSVFDGH